MAVGRGHGQHRLPLEAADHRPREQGLLQPCHINTRIVPDRVRASAQILHSNLLT